MTDTRRPTKADALAALRRMVLTQELPPGTDLDEASLSQRWQLSRTPLRDVLRQLAGEGYVEIRENRGARVSQMTHSTLRDFFLAAPMIYGAVLRLAAQNATDPQIQALRHAQQVFRTSLTQGDTAARALANNRFHEITGEMAGNTYLLPSFQRLLIDHARISMTFYDARTGQTPDMQTPPPQTVDTQTADTQTASDQHDAIIAAIIARDADAAAELATQHWNLSRHRIAQFVMPASLDLALGTV